jgi:multidrug efflux pump subunit AcrA (membrane-fusion protein)
VPDGVGPFVGPGVPQFVMSSTKDLYLETSLTQDDSVGLKAGTRVTVLVPASGVRTDAATVTVVVPAVDPTTTRVPVEIAVPNADGRFLAGAFARVELPKGAEREAFRVPSSALLQRESGFAVWSVGADARARALPVRLVGEEGELSVVVPEDGRWPAGARAVEAPPTGLSEGAAVAEAAR